MRPLLLTLFLATTTLAQTPLPTTPEIRTQEDHLWQAFAAGDHVNLRTLFLPDYIHVEDRIQTLQPILDFIQQCKILRYQISDFQTRPLGPDAALAVYRIANSFTCGSGAQAQIMNFDANSTTIWLRRNGKWLIQAHTETPAAKAPPESAK